jgi:undecaprenyl-diphosphatase
MLEWLNGIDTSIFLFLNGMNHPSFDPVMAAISGKWIWIPLYLFLVGMLILRYKKASWKIIAAMLLVFAITDLASVHLFKNVFLRLRPCHEPTLSGLVHLVNGKCGGSYGFVSSHAANTFGLAMMILFFFRKSIPWLGYGMVVWAAVVSYSRIYLGVHYPGDILGGALLGTMAAWGVWRLLILTSPDLKAQKPDSLPVNSDTSTL